MTLYFQARRATALSAAACVLLFSFIAGCADESHHGRAPVEVDWTPSVSEPEYAGADGPLVLVDAAHGNWHTIDFRFRFFADLVKADGYRVESSDTTITAQALQDADIFVVANAVLGGEDSVWVLPTPPALTSDESEALAQWVYDGGSLLLIADHMPFPASVAELAEKFGAVFINGYAKPSFDGRGSLVFNRSDGALVDHIITNGRNADEKVSAVKTFTGQAFWLTSEAESLMLMPDDWNVYLPENAFKSFTESTPSVPTAGLVQGAVLQHGAGRVAIFGEAAMFTAQAFQNDDGGTIRVGLNDPAAPENAQFVLNVLHWLSAEQGY